MNDETWKLGRRPALDGLRGVAILLVLVCHTGVPGMFGAGPVGVSIFFALSGFLITALLLEERQRTGRIRLGAFYARRARRLVPALAASTLAIIAVSPFFGSWFFEWKDVLAVVFYVGNWVEASPTADLGALGGTWSLAIEEQFYFVWPFVVLLMVRRGPRAVAYAAGTGIVVSLAIRFALFSAGADYERIYYGSDTTAGSLLVGALLAAILHMSKPGKSRPVVATGLAVLLLPLCVLTGNALFVGAMAATPFLMAAILYFTVRGGEVAAWMIHPALRWVGERSYGLYLWHIGFAWVLRTRTDLPWWALVLVVVPVSLAVAELSYRFIEGAFRHKRERVRDVEPTH
ncbi:acyltransferase family protein [Aeromicrobium yanjiei]|uniref:acyltransferase family protein n=1 Tax=Aeromicrobium yanjiei TaxID=2662028 RepID=UPI001892B14F|nr:acyltransferase [Aeromicrobium yanjiei]